MIKRDSGASFTPLVPKLGPGGPLTSTCLTNQNERPHATVANQNLHWKQWELKQWEYNEGFKISGFFQQWAELTHKR